MANKSFYDRKDVPSFQEDICKKICLMKESCIKEGKDDHWFLMCPHYHQWKLGYEGSFVQHQIKWEIEHPNEAEAKHQALVEKAKAWKKSQKKK